MNTKQLTLLFSPLGVPSATTNTAFSKHIEQHIGTGAFQATHTGGVHARIVIAHPFVLCGVVYVCYVVSGTHAALMVAHPPQVIHRRVAGASGVDGLPQRRRGAGKRRRGGKKKN